MRDRCVRLIRIACALGLACVAAVAHGDDEDAPSLDTPLAREFAALVAPRLTPAPAALEGYAHTLDAALRDAGVAASDDRFVVLVDRSRKVQSLLLWWGRASDWRLVGAAPVSTGLPGRFDHFATPLGVFDHSVKNPDFRAEGTQNELGIRGYGLKGARVFDFGWVTTEKGWGDGRPMAMRLQMHATDPDHLEQRLGTAQSKGCIRIPATLDTFLDRFGVLDGDYETELAAGRRMWVLRSDRTPTPWSGRTLVVIDSQATERPAWAALRSTGGARAARATARAETAGSGAC